MPPPLVQRIDAAGFTGSDLLDDENGPSALVFWQCYRDVELWARAGVREGLFRPGRAKARAGEIEALDQAALAEAKPHLAALLEVVRCPEAAEASRIADACSALAGWFEGRGRLRCAVDFAVCAYLASPRQAGLAVRVARLTRVLAEYPRSTSWFDYSIYLARKAHDWQAYAEALAGLGNLYFQLGNFPRARHYHRRCLRAATRNHLREMAGAAYHNLFVLEMDAGNVELAESLAARAFASYGPTSPSVARLARDLSRRWTVLGHFERSLPLALETLNHFSTPADRALVWADVARAAGGAGQIAIFEDAWAESWTLVRRGVTDPVTADVLIDLARGAASLAQVRRAAHAAGKALEVARQRKEGRTVLEAESLLDSLHLQTPEPHPTGLPTTEQLPELAGGILRALRELRAAAV